MIHSPPGEYPFVWMLLIAGVFFALIAILSARNKNTKGAAINGIAALFLLAAPLLMVPLAREMMQNVSHREVQNRTACLQGGNAWTPSSGMGFLYRPGSCAVILNHISDSR